MIAVPLMAALLSSCMFTGVENTGHIKLSKEDLKAVNTLSPEDKIMAGMKPDSLQLWRQGKPFLATSDRVEYIFTAPPANPCGKILMFSRCFPSSTPSGRDAVTIVFNDAEGREYVYTREGTGKISASDIPMMLDLDLVSRVDSMLRGAIVYPRTRFWQSPENTETILSEQQLIPVIVDSVRPNTAEYPCRLVFHTEGGKHGALIFNPSPSSSRSFASQFTITDPKVSFPKIEPGKWRDIQNGRLSTGMTKQEARLALGNPDDIESGHDYSKVIEHWHYSDGTFLRFEDGVLVSFRR